MLGEDEHPGGLDMGYSSAKSNPNITRFQLTNSVDARCVDIESRKKPEFWFRGYTQGEQSGPSVHDHENRSMDVCFWHRT